MTNAQAKDAFDIALPERRSDRPVTLAHRIEHLLAKTLFAGLRPLDVERASAIAGGFTRTVGPLIRSVSHRAEDNLRHAFPDWDEEKVRKTTREVWENLGRTAAEFAFLKEFRPFEDGGRVEIVGEERLRAIAAGDGPVIFVSGHFANWEVMSIAFHRAGIDYGVVYRAANNPLVDEMIIRKRAKVMSRRQIPKDKRGARALVETLKAGRSLAMLVDQKLNDGISVPFMGRDAMTAPSAARLSLRFDVAVVPVSIERLKAAHFRVIINDPIAFHPGGDLNEDVTALTTRINEALERDIRARPGQWLWFHRRWTPPPAR
ncbi:MAG: lysophospholipid acyltransferase family protein [Parvularculaceae bacterium]